MSAALAIVGVGVRGLLTLAQLAARLDRDVTGVTIHLVDPWPDGGGRTWRTDQSPLLLMNGPAATVTAYPGEQASGPSLLEWCREVADGALAVGLPAAVREEAARTGADSYPSRALYGWYLRWVQQRTVAALPAGVSVERHAADATDLDEVDDGRLRLALSDGTVLLVDAAVLALGWLPRQVQEPPAPPERWIPPSHPADQDLTAAAPGARVLLRGLGMSFFDSLVLLTEGRGGRFEEVDGGRLRYRPSGAEPRLLAGSRRGVPFRTKPAVAPRVGVRHDALDRALAAHPVGRPWDVARELLPAIHLDAVHSYYAVLADQAPEAVPGGLPDLLDRLRAAGEHDHASVLAGAVPDPVHRLDLGGLLDPAAGRRWSDASSWRTWLRAHLEADLGDALTDGSPTRAAMRSIGESRPMVGAVVERDGVLPESVAPLKGLMRLGASLAGGPPPLRTTQVLALLDAGVLEIVGPDLVLETAAAGDGLTVRSLRVDAPALPVDVLLDAHLDPPDAEAPADPLLRSLVERGTARPHRVGTVATGAVEVDLATSRLVRADGTPHERVFLLGIPSEGQRVFTILSPKPGGASPILAECATAAEGLLVALREPARG